MELFEVLAIDPTEAQKIFEDRKAWNWNLVGLTILDLFESQVEQLFGLVIMEDRTV